MGDQRGDERGPHGEAFDREDGRTPRTSRRSSSASCGRGWSAAGARLEALTEEERVVSYRRACRHGRMDVIRAELLCRGAARCALRCALRGALAMPPEEPACVFLGGPAEGGGP
jgi:hypothetical protein